MNKNQGECNEKNIKPLEKLFFYRIISFLFFSLFDFKIAIAAIICMLAPILVSVLKGRFWCGNLSLQVKPICRVIIFKDFSQ